jgi:hypothetical protein
VKREVLEMVARLYVVNRRQRERMKCREESLYRQLEKVEDSMTVVVHMACVGVAVLAGSMPETTLMIPRRRMKANCEVRAMLCLYVLRRSCVQRQLLSFIFCVNDA